MEELKQLMMEGFAKLNSDIGEIKQEISGLKQEVSGLNQRMSNVEQDISGLKKDVSELKQDMVEVKSSQVRMEHQLKDNLGALYDAREYQMDINERALDSLARIEKRLDRDELRSLYAINNVRRK